MSEPRGAVLFDVNLLIALAWPNHVHHRAGHAWLERQGERPWATCSMTQAGFLRISANPRLHPVATRTPREAMIALHEITAMPSHVFWVDDEGPATSAHFARFAISGFRQVTDAHLVSLALRHSGQIATFDRGIRDLLPRSFAEEVVEIVG